MHSIPPSSSPVEPPSPADPAVSINLSLADSNSNPMADTIQTGSADPRKSEESCDAAPSDLTGDLTECDLPVGADSMKPTVNIGGSISLTRSDFKAYNLSDLSKATDPSTIPSVTL